MYYIYYIYNIILYFYIDIYLNYKNPREMPNTYFDKTYLSSLKLIRRLLIINKASISILMVIFNESLFYEYRHFNTYIFKTIYIYIYIYIYILCKLVMS